MPRKQRIQGGFVWPMVGLKFSCIASEFQAGSWTNMRRSETCFQLRAHADTQLSDILGVICDCATRIEVCMWCVCPTFGRYAKIRANVGDPDQDCGKIVTIGRISGFGRNPTRVWKSGASPPPAFSEPSRFDFCQPSLWSMPGEQLWISCEPVAALSWMNFYFAAFDLLTQQHPSYWKKLSYKLPFNFVPFDIYRMESELCFEAMSDCHEMEISSQKQFSWDLCVYLKQMFSRVCLRMHCRQLRSKAFWVHLLPSTLLVA